MINPNLGRMEATIIKLIEQGLTTKQQIQDRTGLPDKGLRAAMQRLRIKGWVSYDGGEQWSLSSRAPKRANVGDGRPRGT